MIYSSYGVPSWTIAYCCDHSNGR